MLKYLPFLTILALYAACSTHDDHKSKEQAIKLQPITDTEIANSVLTADTEEMNLSDLGITKAHNKKVRSFAKEMYHAHTMHNAQTSSLMERNKLMAKETKSAMEMKRSSEAQIEDLSILSGREFDRAFMAAQVKMHEDVLEDIKYTLMPNAKNVDLISFLEKTRMTVEHHLDHARKVQASL